MKTPVPAIARHGQTMLECISHSVNQTVRLGQRLGELLRQGDVVLLDGPFGAGKTHLTKGIALGLGADALVNSPSYVLMNEYRAGPQHRRMPIFHIDLYRIEDPAELAGIGLDEALNGDGVCIIEWPHHGGDLLPAEHMRVEMRPINETKRAIRFVPAGDAYVALVAKLKQTAFA